MAARMEPGRFPVRLRPAAQRQRTSVRRAGAKPSGGQSRQPVGVDAAAGIHRHARRRSEHRHDRHVGPDRRHSSAAAGISRVRRAARRRRPRRSLRTGLHVFRPDRRVGHGRRQQRSHSLSLAHRRQPPVHRRRPPGIRAQRRSRELGMGRQRGHRRQPGRGRELARPVAGRRALRLRVEVPVGKSLQRKRHGLRTVPDRRRAGSMNRLFRFFLAVLAVLAPAGYAGAHSSTPVLIQVTRNTVGEIEAPKIRSQQGSSIVFVSDGDVLGPGTAPGHREVYMYSAESGAITRITNTVAGESYEASRETDDVNSGRDVLVAFVSTGDFDPSVGNADHNPEIFLWFEQDGSFLQVTDTVAPVVNGEVYASESGKCLTFRSNADLDDNDGSDVGNPGRGFGNADGSDEVFNLSFGDNDLDRNFWVTTQVSNGPAGTASSHPVVGGYWFTRQCRSNAYQSDHDQLGNGSSGSHIYNYTKNTGVIEQLSKPGAGINRNPAMSSASNFARGPFVVYETDTDPIGNGSSSYELFRFRLFKNEL